MRFKEVVAGAALSAAVFSGCADNGHEIAPTVSSSAPTISPNTVPSNEAKQLPGRVEQPTLEAIASYLQFPTLLKYPAVKSFSFDSGNVQNHVFVLDSQQDASTDNFEKKINYLEAQVAEPTVLPFNFQTSDGKQIQTHMRASASEATERFYLLVPPEFPVVNTIVQDKGSFTYNITKAGQSVSFILDISGRSIYLNLPQALQSLDVEACQSTTNINVLTDDIKAYGKAAQFLAQESHCNGVGSAMAASKQGIPYNGFDQATRAKQIQIGKLLGTFFVPSPDFYAQVPRL